MTGVSNTSFGLNQRESFQFSVLHLAVEVGMDAAIIGASKILPLARIEQRHREVCRS